MSQVNKKCWLKINKFNIEAMIRKNIAYELPKEFKMEIGGDGIMISWNEEIEVVNLADKEEE